MAEENLRDFFPEVREVESKVGRKTPESLLVWMRDAADCGDGGRCDGADRGDHGSAFGGSFSDRISCLKREMRWLRSADVRILRQLLAVHEGIEAMRWLMEERASLVSQGSSLTGSLSSLVTVEEHGPSVTPRRESQSPTFPQDLTKTTSEDSAGHRAPHDDGDTLHKSYLDVLSTEPGGGRPPSPATSEFEHNPGGLRNSQTQDVDAGQDAAAGAGTIRRALLRSRKARKEAKADNSGFTHESGEIPTERSSPQESFRASRNNVREEEEEEEESASNPETVLLGYDAQWCWVESQDDVTFL